MNTQQFIDETTGKPWKDRATGPNEYDCYGLILDYFDKVKGIKLPTIRGYKNGKTSISEGFEKQSKSGLWERAADSEGIVFMGFQGDIPVHCGLVLGDYCLHAIGDEERGGQVSCHKLRVIGRMYERVEYWEYVGK